MKREEKMKGSKTKVFRVEELKRFDPWHVAIFSEFSDKLVIFHNPYVGNKIRAWFDERKIYYEAGVKSIHIPVDNKKLWDFLKAQKHEVEVK